MTSASLASTLLVAGLLAAAVPLGLPGAGHRAGQREALAAPHVAVDELVVPADSVVGLRLETPIAMPEPGTNQAVYARVTRDVLVGGRVAVPTGSRVRGTVAVVQGGGEGDETRGRPRVEVRFHAIELPAGDVVQISTLPVVRDVVAGPPPGAAGMETASAGGAVVGAILGSPRSARVLGQADPGTARMTAADRGPDILEFRAGTVLSVRTRADFTVRVR